MTTRPAFDPRPSMQLVLVACLPGLLALFWQYGWGSLLQLLVAIPVALACEALVCRLRRQPAMAEAALFNQPVLGEGSALVSATLLALALPPYSPWWLTAGACAFALLFGKALFGGFGQNPFNPAMLGYAVVLVAFPALLNQWPSPGQHPGLGESLQQVLGLGAGLPDGWSQATALDSLKHNNRLTIDELFAGHTAFGGFGGRGAEWINLAFLLGGLFLLQRKVIRWHAPVGLLAGLFVASLLCWNGSGSDSNGSPLFHLFSGATMLGAFFIATEPVSGAGSDRARLLFGVGTGVLVYVIRAWGGYADGMAFAILLMNLLVPTLDRLAERGREVRP
ncbi:RnfABCDGE type electron transport complex subunit D [Metapseudomonas resinovorans]|uniref:Ion-translocating oxidoreductase complex subunit D n=1 Tax=Metapseudomonas resinovorans NBRC 106553 TaxID=1245471 RepID=S6ADI3_METRE|nr:RnfABCDGE type electron transport complex subunit D [Pseudomonas resinovorans]BAN47307.1 putative electron transport complex protein RnfD [Pseudomonas resinovorans NBRC 106553]